MALSFFKSVFRRHSDSLQLSDEFQAKLNHLTQQESVSEEPSIDEESNSSLRIDVDSDLHKRPSLVSVEEDIADDGEDLEDKKNEEDLLEEIVEEEEEEDEDEGYVIDIKKGPGSAASSVSAKSVSTGGRSDLTSMSGETATTQKSEASQGIQRYSHQRHQSNTLDGVSPFSPMYYYSTIPESSATSAKRQSGDSAFSSRGTPDSNFIYEPTARKGSFGGWTDFHLASGTKYSDEYHQANKTNMLEDFMEELSPPRTPISPAARTNLDDIARWRQSLTSTQSCGGSHTPNNNTTYVTTSFLIQKGFDPAMGKHEDDFTTPQEKHNEENANGTLDDATHFANHGFHQSRIPLKRDSSLRRRKEVMENYQKSPTKEISRYQLLAEADGNDPILGDIKKNLTNKRADAKHVKTSRGKVSKSLERKPKHQTQDNGTVASRNIRKSRSTGGINKIFQKNKKDPNQDRRISSKSLDRGKQTQNLEKSKIDKGEKSKDELVVPKYGEDRPHNSADLTVESLSRMSTANSTISTGFEHIQLCTQVTLKSPFDGQKLIKDPPPNPPEDFLQQCLEQMRSSEWETNVRGMSGIVRLALHEKEVLIVEYKTMMVLLLKQIKNLRSQVCRAAAHTMAELFNHLGNNMESDLEKVALPLIHKTGDTNKFLREDCHLALDAMVDNLGEKRVISLITSEVMIHKNPTIRGTVSRLLALLIDKHGIGKILSGQREVTDKVIPAVAKLAQDGSQEARMYAKYALTMFVRQHPTWETVLRKNLTQNTMKNLDKIIEAIVRNEQPGFAASKDYGRRSNYASAHGSFSKPNRARKNAKKRTEPNRKTL